jgi:hypothetical protein
MISKEVLIVAEKLSGLEANNISVAVFASLILFTLKDMQLYCLDLDLNEIHAKEKS